MMPSEIEVALPEPISEDGWNHTLYYLHLTRAPPDEYDIMMVTLDRADEPLRYHDQTEGRSGGQVHQAHGGLPDGALLHPLLH